MGFPGTCRWSTRESRESALAVGEIWLSTTWHDTSNKFMIMMMCANNALSVQRTSIQGVWRTISEKFLIMCENIALSVLGCSMLRLWRNTSEMFITTLKWSAPRAPNTSIQISWRLTTEQCTTEKERNVHTVQKTSLSTARQKTSEEFTRMHNMWLKMCIIFPDVTLQDAENICYMYFCSFVLHGKGSHLKKLNPNCP